MNASGGVRFGGDKSAFAVYSRPNFFELYLRDNVPGLLEDAFCGLWRRSGLREVLGNINGHTAFAALRALVDGACLWKANTTIADSLVGLQRVSCAEGGRLSSYQKIGIILLSVGLPLVTRALRRCAKKHFEGVYANELKDAEQDSSGLARTWLRICDRVGKVAMNILPWIRGGFAAVSLLFSVAFLANLTRYATPSDLILGTTVAHASARSAVASQQPKAQGLHGVLQTAASVGSDALRLLLPLLVFGYRSVEWWFSVPHAIATRKNRTQLEWEGVPPPPPPEAPRLAPGVVPPADSSFCPICGKPRRLPAVLSASGYAFCFPCIVKYVRQYHKCPLTGLPADETQVHRLYLK